MTYKMPLVDAPITKIFNILGPDSQIEITIQACPSQAVTYGFVWKKTPPAGKKVMCDGQVELIRRAAKRSADMLGKVRAISDGSKYANDQFLKQFRLHEVDDFQFHGRLLEIT